MAIDESLKKVIKEYTDDIEVSNIKLLENFNLNSSNIVKFKQIKVKSSDDTENKLNEISNVHKKNTNRFFFTSKNAENNRVFYNDSLVNSNRFVVNFEKNIGNLLSYNEFEFKEVNFGNNLYDFYKVNNASEVFGKIYDIILDDVISSNTLTNYPEEAFVDINTSNFSSNDKIDSNSLGFIYDKVWNLASDEGDLDQTSFLINSDRSISQIITYNAFSFKDPYIGSLYDGTYNLSSEDNVSLNFIKNKLNDKLGIINISSSVLSTRKLINPIVSSELNIGLIDVDTQQISNTSYKNRTTFIDLDGFTKNVFYYLSSKKIDINVPKSVFVDYSISRFCNINNSEDKKVGTVLSRNTSKFFAYMKRIEKSYYQYFKFNSIFNINDSNKPSYIVNNAFLNELSFNKNNVLKSRPFPVKIISFQRNTLFKYNNFKIKYYGFSNEQVTNQSLVKIRSSGDEDNRIYLSRDSSITVNNNYKKNEDYFVSYFPGGFGTYKSSIDFKKIIKLGYETPFPRNDKNFYNVLYVLKNSLNSYNTDDMKQKFFYQEDSMNKEEESYENRVVISTEDSVPKKNIFNTNSLFANVDNIKNENWFAFSIMVKRFIEKLKDSSIKSNKSSYKKVVDFYEKFSKEATRIFKGEINFAKNYGNKKFSIENLDNSNFISSIEGQYSLKNNFSKVSEFFIQTKNNNLNDEDLFSFSSKDYEKFLSDYYSKSYFKNNTIFLKETLKRLKEVFEGRTYKTNSIDRRILGFDKLLSDALSNSSSSDVIKMILLISICKSNNISLQKESLSDIDLNLYNKINEVTNGLYSRFLKEVYSNSNLKKQKTYTIKKLKDTNKLDIIYTERREERVNENLFLNKKDSIYFLFPFVLRIESIPGSVVYIDNSNAITVYAEASSADTTLDPVDNYIGLLYDINDNYDAYLFKEKEESEFSSTAFSIEENNIKVKYKYVIPYVEYVKDCIKDEESDIPDNLNYYTYHLDSSEYSLYRFEEKSFYNFLIKEFYNIYTMIESKKSFDNIEEVFNSINNNSGLIDILESYCKIVCPIYSTIFDDVVDMSIKESLFDINFGETSNIRDTFMWKQDVLDLAINELDVLTNFIKEADIMSYGIADRFEEGNIELVRSSLPIHYTKRFSELLYVIKSLKFDDYLTAASHDAVYSYMKLYELNRERILSLSELFLNNKNKLLEDIDNQETINLDIDLDLIAKDKCKVRKIRKVTKENFFWINSFYNEFNDGELYRNLEEKFKLNENKIFSSYENLLKSKEIVFNSLVDSIFENNLGNYSIFRIGIPYSISNMMLNNKILRFKITPINVKFPEIPHEPLYYYYSPVFTSFNFSDYYDKKELFGLLDTVGFYDYDATNYENFYSLKQGRQIISEASNILEKVNILNQTELRPSKLSSDAVTSCKINAISLTNKLFLNVESYLKDFYANSTISESFSEFVNEMNSTEFEFIFNEKYQNTINIIDNEDFEEDIITNNISVIDYSKIINSKNKAFNTIKNLDFNINNVGSISSLLEEEYFDTFSFKINKSDLLSNGNLQNIERFYENLTDLESDSLYSFDSSFFDSYTYIIEVEVI